MQVKWYLQVYADYNFCLVSIFIRNPESETAQRSDGYSS